MQGKDMMEDLAAGLRVSMPAYFLKGVALGAVLVFVSWEVAYQAFWFFVLAVFLFSLPVVVSGFYLGTVRQIRSLVFFRPGGWLHRIFSRRFFRLVFWALWAIPSSFFLLIQFRFCTFLEWLVLFSALPILGMVFLFVRRILRPELKPWLVTATALVWARRTTPFLLLILYGLLLYAFGGEPGLASLEEAIEVQRKTLPAMGDSVLFHELTQFFAAYEGARLYLAGRMGGGDVGFTLFLLLLGGGVFFFNVCAMLSCFLIPGREFRRVWGSLSDADIPPQATPVQVAVFSAIGVFVVFFCYLPAMVGLEWILRQHPELGRTRQEAEAIFVLRVEEIDARYFREGTLDALREARLEALHRVELSLVHLEGQVDRAFDRVEVNVERYLDWYYSLPAEYGRMGRLLIGKLETYMIRKLEAHLMHGDPFRDVDAALQRMLEAHGEALQIYKVTVERILAENLVEKQENAIPHEVALRASLQEVLDLSIHADAISFGKRVTAGGAAAGVVTGLVVKKTVGKVAAQNTFKLAAKSLGKVLASKGAGAASGAAAGAAAGAFVGGPAGAVLGGIAGGIAAGVTVDKMLLMLEEAVSREDFRREILTVIHTAREELLSEIRGQHAGPR
jgi:hypothetical protein